MARTDKKTITQRLPPRRRRVLMALGWHHQLIQRGVGRYGREANWHLTTDTARASWLPHGWVGDGIITNGYTAADLERQQQSLKIPIVAMDERFDGRRGRCGRVMSDSEAVGRMAATHFIDRGFRHFASFVRFRGPVQQACLRGYKATLHASGFRNHGHCWENVRDQYGLRSWGARQEWFKQEIRKLPRPIAIFVYDDALAGELLEACEDLRVAVPEEIAVLGVLNDEEICDLAPCPLSSIDVNLEMLGYQAAQLLDNLMRGAKAPTSALLVPPKGVVIRRSSDILAISDPGVARALQFLRENLHNPMLTVDQVVDHVHMSKRSLYAAFERHLGRPPHEELVRLRLDKTKDLLLKTDLRMKEIWPQAGFSSLHNMYQVFKREEGIPPQQYRERTLPPKS